MLRIRSLIALLCVSQLFSAQPQADEAAVWRNFVEWLRKQPPIAASALIPSYKPQLVSAGLSDAQADEQLSLIRRLAKEKRLELVAIDFDKYYAGNTPNFSKQTNVFLSGVVADLKPGSALDVAMGQGRNTLLLAQKGWDVTGFDVSREGLRVARERAEKAGVKINTVEAAHQEFDFGRDRWDLVVLMYSWAPVDRPEFVKRVYDSLRPGGLVVLEDNEGSLPAGASKAGRNPLLKWFEDFRILRYETAPSGGDWGNPKNAVYRLLAQKP